MAFPVTETGPSSVLSTDVYPIYDMRGRLVGYAPKIIPGFIPVTPNKKFRPSSAGCFVSGSIFSAETEGFIHSEVDLGGDYGPNPELTTQSSCREEAYSLISATPDELIPQWSVSCGNTRQKQFTSDLENKTISNFV
ncbi:hypothetical protein GEMRC1_013649 [Eukaryota sp. GEM-RC1]